MFKDVNPGLARRFQLKQEYGFSDYDDASLLKMLRAKARAIYLSIPVSVTKFTVRNFARARAYFITRKRASTKERWNITLW